MEDLLVLNPAEDAEVAEFAGRLEADGCRKVGPDDPHLNPYWPGAVGRVFVGPDSYQLVIAPLGG